MKNDSESETGVYIALGSNLGDRRSNLIDAISQLRQKVLIDQISAVYETEPVEAWLRWLDARRPARPAHGHEHHHHH